MMTYHDLISSWENYQAISTEFVPYEDFSEAMILLTEYRKDLTHWQNKAQKLESELDDYKAREQQMDVIHLRSEVRAMQTRVNALETTLKLIQNQDMVKPS